MKQVGINLTRLDAGSPAEAKHNSSKRPGSILHHGSERVGIHYSDDQSINQEINGQIFHLKPLKAFYTISEIHKKMQIDDFIHFIESVNSRLVNKKIYIANNNIQ